MGYVGNAANDNGMMLDGANNPADRFNIIELNLDQAGGTELILGLGGKQQGGPAIFTPKEGNMTVDATMTSAVVIGSEFRRQVARRYSSKL